MAETVDIPALRKALRDTATPANGLFGLLRQVSQLVNENPDSQTAMEMVLRALERRDSFGALGTVLDALTRRVGLFPYLQSPETLSLGDMIAYEAHRPDAYDEDIVFHRVQLQIYRRLMAGENVILSAPTSFGKSKIIDAIISGGQHQNVAVIVPTLALIDETRRRLSRFGSRYKIVTTLSQRPAERNLFVLTAERAVAYENLPRVGFFVIDEFYKLGTMSDGGRMVALNEIFYKLRKGGGQFYLLGPNIEQIPHGAAGTLHAHWIKTDYHTVVSEQLPVPAEGTKPARLVNLCRTLAEPTIIYCASPRSANEVARVLVEAGEWPVVPELEPAAKWAADHFHPEWVFVRALRHGIGIHHGPLPRSLAQLVVREFNAELARLRFLVCTSTLIEGVNTKAKNVIIYDKKVGISDFDYFTFNNIRGRAGRMYQHFVGRVFLFAEPPTSELPYVDLPVVTQGEDTPSSLLMQFDPADLTSRAAERLRPLLAQETLPVSVLRENKGVEPEAQIALAEDLTAMPQARARILSWSGFPRYEELKTSCELIWEYLVPQERRSGVHSGSQLTLKTWKLLQNQSVSVRVGEERNGAYAAKSVDEAVERVLGFDRTWASFELPKYLMALSRIQDSVFSRRGFAVGNYQLFAMKLSHLFRAPILSTLDEYGIPPPIGERLLRHLGTEDDVDHALTALRGLELQRTTLSEFERAVVREAQQTL